MSAPNFPPIHPTVTEILQAGTNKRTDKLVLRVETHRRRCDSVGRLFPRQNPVRCLDDCRKYAPLSTQLLIFTNHLIVSDSWSLNVTARSEKLMLGCELASRRVSVFGTMTFNVPAKLPLSRQVYRFILCRGTKHDNLFFSRRRTEIQLQDQVTQSAKDADLFPGFWTHSGGSRSRKLWICKQKKVIRHTCIIK